MSTMTVQIKASLLFEDQDGEAEGYVIANTLGEGWRGLILVRLYEHPDWEDGHFISTSSPSWLEARERLTQAWDENMRFGTRANYAAYLHNLKDELETKTEETCR